jgi:hypothetical protein
MFHYNANKGSHHREWLMKLWINILNAADSQKRFHWLGRAAVVRVAFLEHSVTIKFLQLAQVFGGLLGSMTLFLAYFTV